MKSANDPAFKIVTHERIFSLFHYMAGMNEGFVTEMQLKMAYFRGDLDISIGPRPSQDNGAMIKYINQRWETNNNIRRGAHVDIIFMAVSNNLPVKSPPHSLTYIV